MRNRRTIWSLYGLIFFLQLGFGNIGPVLPDLGREFQLSVMQLGVIVSAFPIARLILDVPAGSLADRFPPRRLLAGGTALSVLGFLISANAGSDLLLIAGRFLCGVASAICVVVALVTLTRLAAPTERGRVLGTHQAMMVSGIFMGPAIAGLVATFVGWRMSFLVSALAGLIAGGLVVLFLGNVEAASKARSVSRSAEAGPGSSFPAGVIALHAATVILFFGGGAFRQTIVSVFGSERLALDAAAIGLILASAEVVRFFSNLIGGRAADRYERLHLVVLGLLLGGVSAAAFAMTDSAVALVAILLLQAAPGYTYTVSLQVQTELVPPGRVSRTVGQNRFFGDLGSAAGPLVLTAVVAQFGFEAAFVVTGLLYFVCAGLVWLVFRRRPAQVRVAA